MTFKKKFYFSKEERRVRELIKGIREQETEHNRYWHPYSNIRRLKPAARFLAKSYKEMFDILESIDDLYHILVSRRYSSNYLGSGTNRFELVDIPRGDPYEAWMDGNSHFERLISAMISCKREHGGFTLDDERLGLVTNSDESARIEDRVDSETKEVLLKISNRLYIGDVYKLEYKSDDWDHSGYVGGPEQLHFILSGKIVKPKPEG